MTENVTRSDAVRRASVEFHPLGHLGEPADIATTVEWLLAPAHTWTPACTSSPHRFNACLSATFQS